MNKERVWDETEGEAVKEHDHLSTASLNRHQLFNKQRQKSSVTEKGCEVGDEKRLPKVIFADVSTECSSHLSITQNIELH